MKKFITLAAIILTAVSAKAQTYFNNARADYDMYYESKFGIEVSGNLASASPSSNFKTGSVAGFTAGVNMNLPVNYTISIVPAILFTQKGFSANTQSGNYTQRTQSIDIPVMAKFRSGSRLNFFLGPQVSYLVSNTNQFNQNFAASARPAYEYSGSNIRLQGVAGAGVDVTRKLSLHARYAFDLQSTAQNGNSTTPVYRMQAWQFGFGVNI
ncbi:MAG: porin family protein [Bacteroidota bacterium]